jgi:3-mercaptopyruvate sulfurtransferase SseA
MYGQMTEALMHVETISTEALGDRGYLVHDGRPAVLDVRRADEHRRGHVTGSTNIPLHDLVQRLDDEWAAAAHAGVPITAP